MGKLGEALKKKFKTPQDAARALGIDASLLKIGRAGPDVVVGDSALDSTATNNMELEMTKVVLTRKAAVAQGAVLAHLRPLLAADAKLDLAPAFQGVTSKNMKEKRQSILDALKPRVSNKLLAGVAMDTALKAANQALDEAEPMDVEEGEDTDPNGSIPEVKKVGEDEGDIRAKMKEVLARHREHLPPALLNELDEAMGAEESMDEDLMKRREGEDDSAFAKRVMDSAKARDNTPEPKPATVTKEAMDAQITARVTAAVEGERKRNADLRDAERFVEPWVGKIAMAQDSAEGVYRAALGMLNVKHDDVKDPAALKHIIAAQPKPGQRQHSAPVIAADAAGDDTFSKMFPGADRIGVAA